MATSTIDKKVENCNNYENIIKVIDTTAGRRVLETRLEKNELIVCVTDGVNVWRKGVDKLHSKDYFTKFCNALVNGEIKLTQDGAHMELSHSNEVVQLELEELSVHADRQSELQRILFRSVERSEELETRLKTSEGRVEALQRKSATTKNVFDVGYESKRRKVVPKSAPKLPGMSVVNPGSKKRSAPKGVEFN